MTIEDSTPASAQPSRYLGAGFRLEPDFRDGPPTLDVAQAADNSADATAPTLARRLTVPNLDYVFDDPADGEPGRDRMLVHGLWELLLAVALAGLSFLLYQERSAAFSGDGLRLLLLAASVLGLLALGSALALRAAVPNLAVGAVAVAASLYVGQNASASPGGTLLVVVGVCAIIGLVHGLIIVGLHVPGWAASLAVGLALLVWTNRQVAVTPTPGYDPTPHAFLWFAGFVAVSVAAGLVTVVPFLRRASGRFRAVADPAQRRGVIAAVIALGATVVSTMLAGLAGALAVSLEGSAAPSDGLVLTALALGAALLGGTSAYGRRGGIFGTVFAVCLLAVASQYAEAAGHSWPPVAMAAIAIAVGLAVTRLVERFGRPSRALEDEGGEWMPNVNASTWTPEPTSIASTTPTPTASLWNSEEAWGSTVGR